LGVNSEISVEEDVAGRLRAMFAVPQLPEGAGVVAVAVGGTEVVLGITIGVFVDARGVFVAGGVAVETPELAKTSKSHRE
jgi:hypothetical protein